MKQFKCLNRSFSFITKSRKKSSMVASTATVKNNLEVLRSIGCTPLKVKERTVSYKKAVLSHFSLYSEREDIISRLKLLKSTILNFGLSNFLMGLLDP